jgi:hypothetical protein
MVLVIGHVGLILLACLCCYMSTTPSQGATDYTHPSKEPKQLWSVVYPSCQADEYPSCPAEPLSGANLYPSCPAQFANASVANLSNAADYAYALFRKLRNAFDGCIMQALLVFLWDMLLTIGLNVNAKWRLEAHVIRERCLNRALIPALGVCLISQANWHRVSCVSLFEVVAMMRGLTSYYRKGKQVGFSVVRFPKTGLVRFAAQLLYLCIFWLATWLTDAGFGLL